MPAWVCIAVRAAFVGVPQLSLGTLTGPAFAWAALRLRSGWLGAAATVYVGLTVALCSQSVGVNGATPTPPMALVVVAYVVNILLGTAHAAVVQQRLFRNRSVPPDPLADPALVAACDERMRQHASQICAPLTTCGWPTG